MKHFKNSFFLFWLLSFMFLVSLFYFSSKNSNSIKKIEVVNRIDAISLINQYPSNGYSFILNGDGAIWADRYINLLKVNKSSIKKSQLDSYNTLLTQLEELKLAPTVDSSIILYRKINFTIFN